GVQRAPLRPGPGAVPHGAAHCGALRGPRALPGCAPSAPARRRIEVFVTHRVALYAQRIKLARPRPAATVQGPPEIPHAGTGGVPPPAARSGAREGGRSEAT